MATNYFGTYYLTHMLLEDLKASAPSRMVITNSLSEMHGHLEFDDLKCARWQAHAVHAAQLPPPWTALHCGCINHMLLNTLTARVPRTDFE